MSIDGSVSFEKVEKSNSTYRGMSAPLNLDTLEDFEKNFREQLLAVNITKTHLQNQLEECVQRMERKFRHLHDLINREPSSLHLSPSMDDQLSLSDSTISANLQSSVHAATPPPHSLPLPPQQLFEIFSPAAWPVYKPVYVAPLSDRSARGTPKNSPDRTPRSLENTPRSLMETPRSVSQVPPFGPQDLYVSEYLPASLSHTRLQLHKEKALFMLRASLEDRFLELSDQAHQLSPVFQSAPPQQKLPVDIEFKLEALKNIERERKAQVEKYQRWLARRARRARRLERRQAREVRRQRRLARQSRKNLNASSPAHLEKSNDRRVSAILAPITASIGKINDPISDNSPDQSSSESYDSVNSSSLSESSGLVTVSADPFIPQPTRPVLPPDADSSQPRTLQQYPSPEGVTASDSRPVALSDEPSLPSTRLNHSSGSLMEESEIDSFINSFVPISDLSPIDQSIESLRLAVSVVSLLDPNLTTLPASSTDHQPSSQEKTPSTNAHDQPIHPPNHEDHANTGNRLDDHDHDKTEQNAPAPASAATPEPLSARLPSASPVHKTLSFDTNSVAPPSSSPPAATLTPKQSLLTRKVSFSDKTQIITPSASPSPTNRKLPPSPTVPVKPSAASPQLAVMPISATNSQDAVAGTNSPASRLPDDPSPSPTLQTTEIVPKATNTPPVSTQSLTVPIPSNHETSLSSPPPSKVAPSPPSKVAPSSPTSPSSDPPPSNLPLWKQKLLEKRAQNTPTVTPTAVTPTAVTPAAGTPAVVTPAVVTPAVVTPPVSTNDLPPWRQRLLQRNAPPVPNTVTPLPMTSLPEFSAIDSSIDDLEKAVLNLTPGRS